MAIIFVIRYATTMLVTTTAPVELDIQTADFLHAQVFVSHLQKKGNSTMQSLGSGLHHCEVHLFSSAACIIHAVN